MSNEQNTATSAENTDSVKLSVISQAKQSIEKSGFDHKKAQVYLSKFMPYMMLIDEYEKEIDQINHIEPTEQDSKKARDLRLRYAKQVRIPSGNTKDELKKDLLTEIELIQSLHNVVEKVCKIKEAHLDAIEKSKELRNKKEREEILKKYNTDISKLKVDLAKIDESTFEMIHQGVKSQYEKQQAEEKAKQEEEAKNKQIKELNDSRKDQLIPYWNFIPSETKSKGFGEITEEEFKTILSSAKEESEKAKKAFEKAAEDAERIRIRTGELHKIGFESGENKIYRNKLIDVTILFSEIEKSTDQQFKNIVEKHKKSYNDALEKQELKNKKINLRKAELIALGLKYDPIFKFYSLDEISISESEIEELDDETYNEIYLGISENVKKSQPVFTIKGQSDKEILQAYFDAIKGIKIEGLQSDQAKEIKSVIDKHFDKLEIYFNTKIKTI